jgi:hypothetical protein
VSQSFMGGPPPMDNVQLREWIEVRRRALHMASVELAVSASEIEAWLRRVSNGRTIGGMSARKRARLVANAIRLSAMALTIAAKYLSSAYARFVAAYQPELEAASAAKRRQQAFIFKADR